MGTTAVVGLGVVGSAVVGSSAVDVSTAVYLYAPPWYEQHQVMRGALRYRIATSTTVYRINGTWHNVLAPGMSNPNPADCDVDAASGLRLYFNKPMVVPGSLHDELQALTPADPAWNPGSLTLL